MYRGRGRHGLFTRCPATGFAHGVNVDVGESIGPGILRGGRPIQDSPDITTEKTTALVIADTHVPRRAKRLPESLIPYLEGAGVILHAGDLMDASLLDVLDGYAPTLAVRGNLDPPHERLPGTREFVVCGVNVAMVHDSGTTRGRRNRMRRRFPEARVVVFGHSHIPYHEDDGQMLLLNPGSPTDRRRQPDFTFAVMDFDGGDVDARIEVLRPPEDP